MDKNNMKFHFGKRLAVAVIAGMLAFGLLGCSVEDIFSNFNVGDVPFEDQATAPTDMGVVDNRPVIPEDVDFDDLRYDPV